MERSTFSLPERKSCKKKQASLLLERPVSMGIVYHKAHSLYAKACAERRTFRLTKGISPLDGSLRYFDRMEAFLLVRQQDYFSPKSQFYPHQVWKNNGVAPFKSILGAK